MAVGNVPSVAQLNGSIFQLASQLHTLMGQISGLQQWTVAEGTAGLEAIGFDSADATTFMSLLNYMNTVASVYFGTATQPGEYNFDNQLCTLWGGQ
jgi:hypothetical protein